MPDASGRRPDPAQVGTGDPHEAEFISVELNVVDLLTGETQEIPLTDDHLETLRVTKRGRTSTSGRTADTGGVTVKSEGGRVRVEDGQQSYEVTPKPGVMGKPRPSSGFPRGRGRRRRDEDVDEYNGRNQSVHLTLT